MMSKNFVIAFMALTAATNGSAMAASMPVAFSADFSVGSNSTRDPLLSTGAVAGAVLAGLRESGVAAQENPPEADVGISLDVSMVYSPQVENLRIVSGTLAVRVPRPGAADFSNSLASCERNFQFWGASGSQELAVQRIKLGLTTEARRFVQLCRRQLNF